MKAIFLDIDGCLATSYGKQQDTCIGRTYVFGKGAVQNLNKVLEATDAQIVLSSTWRLVYKLEQMQAFFAEQKVIRGPIGYTPCLNNGTPGNMVVIAAERSAEISTYIMQQGIIRNSITHYAVIDDENMAKAFGPHFVLCGIMGLADPKKPEAILRALEI
jgi:hypothetical protein